jgi:eukaryotic-like serine/threonine-protein kinase
MRSDDIHPGDLIAGKYRVRTVLGRNHGLLLEAFHTEFDQRVVVKILPAGHGDTKEMERFRREARTLAKLESEHVARIIDVGSQDDGSFYLVRQYLEGIDLAQHLRQTGPLPLPDAVLLLAQAAEAVAETHGHGIILREMQPSHLFLTQRAGGTPLLKLIDFGTAKLMREVAAPTAGGELTATAMFGISPYSSPELVRKAKNVDTRTDVWSLGAILYEMLTGRAPFTGEMAMLMLQITKEEPVPATQFRPDLPAEIDQVLSWAMAKDLDGRFRNVHAFAHALLPYASSEGQVLIERIGQITRAAKSRKQGTGAAGGPTPLPGAPVASPPLASPVPPPPDAMAPAGRLRQEDSVTRIKGSSFTTPSEPPAAPGASGGTGAAGYAAASSAQPAGASALTPGAGTSPNGSSPAPSMAAGAASSDSPQGAGSSVPAASGMSPLRPSAASPSQRDRSLLYGVLAALAVVVPVLVAVFVLSRKSSSDVTTPVLGVEREELPELPSRKSSSDVTTPVGEARSSAPVKVDAPAETAAPSERSASAAPSAVESAEPAAEAPAASAEAEAAPSIPARSGSDRSSSVVTKVGSSGVRRPSAATSEPELPPVDYNPKPEAAAESASGSGPGTLVAVVTGGSCAFSVNGASKGTSSSIKLQMPPGDYSITCKPSSGAAKSKSATVKSGQTAFITFKF